MHNNLLGFFCQRFFSRFDRAMECFLDGEISAFDVFQRLLERERECRFVLEFCSVYDLITPEEFENLSVQISVLLDDYKRRLPDF